MARLRYLQNKRSGVAGTISKATNCIYFYDDDMYLGAYTENVLDLVGDEELWLFADDIIMVGDVHVLGDFDHGEEEPGGTFSITLEDPTAAANAIYGLVDTNVEWTGNVVALRGKVEISGSEDIGGATGVWAGIDFEDAIGDRLGLVCALNAEVSSDNTSAPNAIIYIQSLPDSSSADFSTVPYIAFTENASDSAQGSNVLFSLGHQPAGSGRNVTSGSGGIYHEQTIKIEANGTAMYIPLSTGQGNYTTAYPIVSSNATDSASVGSGAIYTSGGLGVTLKSFFGGDMDIADGKKIIFRAATEYIFSSNTGYIDIDANLIVDVVAPTITLTGSTKINLDGATDITGAVSLDSAVVVSNAVLSLGKSGANLDFTALAGSNSGMQIRLTSDYAGTATSMKGADIRTTATGGTTGSVIGIQTVVVRSSGDALLKEIWGINNIVQLTGGQAASIYGVVGDVTVATGTKVGTDGSGSYLAGGLFRLDVSSGLDFADVGISAPVVAWLVGSGAAKRKAEAGVCVVLGGDSAIATGGAAFKVIRLSSIDASKFDYGLDFVSAATGYKVNEFVTADIRLSGGATFVNTPATDILTITEGTIVLSGAITAGGTLTTAYPIVSTYSAATAISIASSMATAHNVMDITVTDATTLAAGRGRALYLKYTVSGTKTDAFAVRTAAIDTYISNDCPGVTGLDMYMGNINDKTMGNIMGIAMYCEDIGSAAAASWVGIDIGRVIENTAAARDTFMRFKSHGATTRAKSIFYLEGSNAKLAGQLFMWGGAGEGGSDFIDLTTDLNSGHSIVGTIRVGKEAVIGGGVTTQYYIPLYTAN